MFCTMWSMKDGLEAWYCGNTSFWRFKPINASGSICFVRMNLLHDDCWRTLESYWLHECFIRRFKIFLQAMGSQHETYTLVSVYHLQSTTLYALQIAFINLIYRDKGEEMTWITPHPVSTIFGKPLCVLIIQRSRSQISIRKCQWNITRSYCSLDALGRCMTQHPPKDKYVKPDDRVYSSRIARAQSCISLISEIFNPSSSIPCTSDLNAGNGQHPYGVRRIPHIASTTHSPCITEDLLCFILPALFENACCQPPYAS